MSVLFLSVTYSLLLVHFLPFFSLCFFTFFKSESEVVQSCSTLYDLVDCSPPGSSVHGILQARILEWVAISFFRVSSRPRDQTQVSHIAGRRFNLWATKMMLKCRLFVVLQNLFSFFYGDRAPDFWLHIWPSRLETLPTFPCSEEGSFDREFRTEGSKQEEESCDNFWESCLRDSMSALSFFSPSSLSSSYCLR